MMHMTFYWGKTVTILFDTWKTEFWTGYLLSLLALFLCSAFYQYLESLRIRIKFLSKPAKKSLEAPLLPNGYGRAVLRKWTASSLAVAGLFGANSAIGYLLMLAVMSFNGGVFLAVVLGLMAGYFVFRSGSEEEDALSLENPCACS